MNQFFRTTFFSLSCSALMTACSYSVSVNDNVVYTPAPLFNDYNLVDVNLRQCVEQTINDKKITDAKQLKLLNCSNAGIMELTGLERFTALEELNLASNALKTLGPIGQLAQLKVLIVSDNQIVSAAPLLTLLHLRLLDLEKNSQLKCGDINQLAANLNDTSAEIFKPKQCL